MSSEIKVDTISENTSANGVAIDSLAIKDGKITNLMNATLSAADLGSGIHIKTADSGASASTAADDLVIEQGSSGNGAGLSILSATDDTCNIFFGDSGDNDIAFIQYNHANNEMTFATSATEALRIGANIDLSTGGEDAPDCSEGGLTLDQNASDGNILTFKSSDIAHGMTGLAETDSFGRFKKLNADAGGLMIEGYTEDVYGIYLSATQTNENTTTSVNAIANIHFKSLIKSGTGSAAISADGNLFAVAGSNTKFIVKGDGDIFADGTLSAYDTYEDAQLVRAFDLSHGKNVINSTFDKYVQYNHETLADANLVGREEDGTPNHMINVTGMQRLHNGAIWQQYEKHEKLANAMYELAKAAVGEDKANEILEQNDIKLLN
jgi:hypothetical protein